MTARVVLSTLCSSDRTRKGIAEVEHHLSTGRQAVCRIQMCLSQPRLVKEILARRMLLRIEVVNNPRRREYPVFKTLIVVAILGVGCQHLAIDSPRQRRPLLRFRNLSIDGIGRHTQPSHWDKRVVLAIRPATPGTRRTELIEQMPLPRDLAAISIPLCRSQIVIEQVVPHSHSIEQMSCGQIHIRLAEAITPHVIADCSVHVTLSRRKIFWITFYLVCERSFGNRKGNIILRTPLFCRRRWRRSLQRANVLKLLLPPYLLRSMRLRSQRLQFPAREVDTRMYAGKLGTHTGLKHLHLHQERRTRVPCRIVFRSQRLAGVLRHHTAA